MRKVISRGSQAAAIALCLALAGCGGGRDAEFSRLLELGERNPQAAIGELRHFLYYNPEHFEAHIALADLLLAHPGRDGRNVYVARHYLSLAASLDVSDEKKSAAMQRYVGAKLRQNVNPENIEHLVTLAQALANNGQMLDAADVYLRAAWVGFSQDNYREAERMGEEALGALEEIDLAKLDDVQQKKAQELRQTVELAAISLRQVRRQFGKSVPEELALTPDTAGGAQFPAPDLAFLQAAATFSGYLEDRQGLGQRLGRALKRMSSDELPSAVEELREELEKVLDADRRNERADDPQRDMLAARIWANLAESISADEEPAFRTAAVERAIFYFDRSGEVEKARALRP